MTRMGREEVVVLDMQNWPRRRFSVTNDLRLDPRNVRLGVDVSRDLPQGDIIRDLFVTEGAFEIAKAILTTGFLTHELPVVVDEGRWVVVEGNRRTAALKVILNPGLMPAFQSRINALLDSQPAPDALKEIECLIAPSRDEANQLIAALHTSNPRKPWGPLRQAEFFGAQLQAGKSVEQLKSEYPGIDVADFVETYEMHRLLKTVDYEDEEYAQYVRRRNFPISTFERLYKNSEFLKLAQLTVDQNTGHVSVTGDPDDLRRLTSRIVGDMKARNIDTRVLNKPGSKTYDKYMAELRKMPVKPARGARPVSSVPEQPAPKLSPRGSAHLNVSGLHPIANYPSIGRMLAELATIPYAKYPNATFDLIRTFVEKAIKAYAEDLGKAIVPAKGRFVYLDTALKWLIDEVTNAGVRSLLQPLNILHANKQFNYQYQVTKDFLDAANHNHKVIITGENVKDIWDLTVVILRYVLRDRTV